MHFPSGYRLKREKAGKSFQPRLRTFGCHKCPPFLNTHCRDDSENVKIPRELRASPKLCSNLNLDYWVRGRKWPMRNQIFTSFQMVAPQFISNELNIRDFPPLKAWGKPRFITRQNVPTRVGAGGFREFATTEVSIAHSIGALGTLSLHLRSRAREETSLNMAKSIMSDEGCLLYTSPSPRDQRGSRMPSSA